MGATKRALAELKKVALERDLLKNPLIAAKVVEIENELLALELTALRVVANSADGKPHPASSVLKLKGTELQQAVSELFVDVAGPLALAAHADEGHRHPRLGAGDRTQLPQPPQGVDLRRVQRDPAPDHRRHDPGALITWTSSSTASRPRCATPCAACSRATTPSTAARSSRTTPASTRRCGASLAEMGLLGLPFAEDDGGMGAGPVELSVVAEEIGRVNAPEPFVESIVLAGGLVAALGTAGAEEGDPRRALGRREGAGCGAARARGSVGRRRGRGDRVRREAHRRQGARARRRPGRPARRLGHDRRRARPVPRRARGRGHRVVVPHPGRDPRRPRHPRRTRPRRGSATARPTTRRRSSGWWRRPRSPTATSRSA